MKVLRNDEISRRDILERKNKIRKTGFLIIRKRE